MDGQIYKDRNREFWRRGYFVDTVGKNTKAIEAYIKNQLREDAAAEQLTTEEIDPAPILSHVPDRISAFRRS